MLEATIQKNREMPSRDLKTCVYGLYGGCSHLDVVECASDMGKIYETLKFGENQEFLWSYSPFLRSKEFEDEYNRLLQERVEILRNHFGYLFLTGVERVWVVPRSKFQCGVCRKFLEKKLGDLNE
jgi:hypothetical protein